MRVLLVVHGYPPGAAGGTEIYVQALARALAGAGHRVSVLTRDADASRPELSLRRAEDGDVAIYAINNTFRACRSFAETYRSPGVARVAADVIAQVRPDVAHVHHLTCLSTEIPAELARRGVPVVLTLHDHWMICHRGQLLDLDLQPCAGPLPEGCPRCIDPATAASGAAGYGAAALVRHVLPEAALDVARKVAGAVPGGDDASRRATLARAEHMREVLSHCSRILAPSRSIRERFVAFGVPAERTEPAHLGIELAPFACPERSRGACLERQPAERLRIGYFGSLMPSKAPHLLLEAHALLPAGRAEVVVHGAHQSYHGDDTYRTRIEPLLAAPGVRYAGAIDHANVPRALSEVDVVVVPSIWPENSPLVVREAFAARCPVVGADVGGIPEMIEPGRDGLLFRAGDASDLARVLRRLLHEPDLLPALRAGIAPVRSIETDAAACARTYASLLPAGEREPFDSAQGRPGAALVAAVVLHHRTFEQTLLCVRSLQAAKPPLGDVLVLDNASGDGTGERLREALPGVTHVTSPRNVGFAGGANLGILWALSRGHDVVVLVNSDAWVPPDTIARLGAALRADPSIGIAAPVIHARADPDVVASAGIHYDTSTGRMYHLTDPERPRAAVSGCVMAIRREALAAAGMLDEDFFFSFEDVDLCLRASAVGFRSIVVPDAHAYHEGAATIGPRSPRRLYYAVRNHLRLASRTPAGWLPRPARTAFVLGLNLAHVLLTSGVPWSAGLRAFLAGVRDHVRGRYGPGEFA